MPQNRMLLLRKDGVVIQAEPNDPVLHDRVIDRVTHAGFLDSLGWEQIGEIHPDGTKVYTVDDPFPVIGADSAGVLPGAEVGARACCGKRSASI